MKLETTPPHHFLIIFTDGSTVEVDGYGWRIDSGLLMIRTTPHGEKHDMYFPIVNMFQWKRTDG